MFNLKLTFHLNKAVFGFIRFYSQKLERRKAGLKGAVSVSGSTKKLVQFWTKLIELKEEKVYTNFPQ